MRRLLPFALSWALFACGQIAWAEEGPPLRVAPFACDVTPPPGTWLFGKPLAKVEHPLLAKGLILDDGTDRYVLCAVDWCILSNGSHDLLCQRIAKAAGADPAHVVVHSVHVHTGPIYDGDAWALLVKSGHPPKDMGMSDPAFVGVAADRLEKVVKESLGQFEPVDRIGTAEATVERIASARRVPDKDGKIQSRYSFTPDARLRAAPEGRIDPKLKTITLARGNRPVARLHYYAVHPQSYYRDGRASYDFVGMARETLQKEEGVFQIYFTGCAGDVTVGKYNDGTPLGRAGMAERLLTAMRTAVAETQFTDAGPIAWRNVDLRLTFRVHDDAAADRERAVLNDPKGKNRSRAARGLALFQRADRPLVLSALAIGKARVVHLPGEPMLAFQFFAQNQRPDAFVTVAGYGDGAPWYLCTQAAFAEGGYEPSASEAVPESEILLKRAIAALLAAP